MGESVRSIEETAIRRKLQPLGLEIYEVKADGHCLYRSLEDQLALSARPERPSARAPQRLLYRTGDSRARSHIQA